MRGERSERVREGGYNDLIRLFFGLCLTSARWRISRTGGHVHADSPAESFLQSVPPANRILRGPTPGLDGSFRRRLLLVRTPERHPIAARLEHRMQVVDAPEVISEFRAPRLDDRRGGSSVSSRNVRNSDVPLGVLRCHGCSRVPSPTLPDFALPATSTPPQEFVFRGPRPPSRTRAPPTSNEPTLSISTVRRLQVTAVMERFKLLATVSPIRDSPKNGRHSRAFL